MLKLRLMKFTKLLVLGALCLTATSAMAEIVDGVRQRPNVAQKETFQADQIFYLFNVQARMFFCGANDWETRASVSPTGYKVKFTATDDDITMGNVDPEQGIYEFTDSAESKKAWLSVFSTNDAGAIWVDNATETYRFWKVNELPNSIYRLSNPALEDALVENDPPFTGKFLGWRGDEGDTRLYFVDPADEGAGVDWVFVTEETYQNWKTTWEGMKDQFEKAAELKVALDAAKKQNIDVATEEAVYLDETATVEQLEDAITAVQKKINDALAGDASVQNPSDMTGSILNPNFDNASADGWKGTSPNMVGSGSHGPANVAEHYNKTFDTYQELKNMPSGVYMLENSGFFRGSWDDAVNHTNYVAFLYAIADGDTLQTAMANPWEIKNQEPMAGATEFGTTAAESTETRDGETYYAPTDPSAARLYFEKGYYNNKVFFAVEEGAVKLGVKKDVKVTGSDWAVFDSFKLTFYGNAAEAYQYWIRQTPKVEIDAETAVSKQYLEAYEAAFKLTASNKAEAVAVMNVIKAAEDSISKNISLWKELVTAYAEANLYTIGQYSGLSATDDLGDYLMDVEDEYLSIDDNDNRTQSNAELEAIIAKMAELVEAVVAEYKNQIPDDTDMTEFVKTPGFDDGRGNKSTEGWTVDSKGGGNVQLGGNSDNWCFEAWHSTNFDVWQEIKDLPVGVYEIEVQGYVRYKDGQDAIDNKDNQPENIPIYVYMNDSKTNFVNWFSYPKAEEFYTAVSGATYLTDGDGWCYPDNMIAASAAFNDGGYKQSAKGLVSTAGDVLRIGVKGNPEAMFWPIFDNFKLTYRGKSVDVVKPELEKKLSEASIVMLGVITTKSAYAALEEAILEAEGVVEGESGAEMFNALSKLTKALNAVEEGTVLCNKLAEKIAEMMNIASTAESSAAADASNYGAVLQGNLEACELDAEDIEAAMLTVREYILKMQLPDNYETGSAEGVDVTAFIQTPDFQKMENGVETNAIDGWQGTAGYNFGNNDTQKGALALEFYEKTFDMYQEIEGVGEVVLPNGNYMVCVNAFERVTEDTPAYLYANNKQVELMTLDDGVDTDAGEVAPNDMVSSVEAFSEGRYLNTVFVAVTENKLRLGIKHEQSAGGDWIIMDNFKLLFYGDNVPAESVEKMFAGTKTMKVEYFTLDGRRVNGVQKGITIRKAVMDNGTVVIKKIRK